VLGDNALLTAYALRKQEIDAAIVREVAEDLSITANAEARHAPLRQFANNTNRNYPPHALSVQSVEIRPGVPRFETKVATVKQLPKAPVTTPVVPGVFFDALAAALTEAMGPMAGIVLRDQIKNLGESSESFPLTRLDLLVESLNREILDETMRAQFRQQVFQQIRTLQIGN
jgi:hypothetical protein